MKLKKIKYIIPLMLVGILVAMPQVYAKTSIEIKPNSTVYTNKTISDFFDESMAMGNVGEGLESDNVDVHMATNMDWAMVSYFSNSAYGTNGAGENRGIQVSINGTDYFSTNGNATGVMDFGKNITYTSGVISNYSEISNTSTLYSYGKSIIENATINKYVDLINTLSTKEMGAQAWYDAKVAIWNGPGMPYSIRKGLFTFQGGDGSMINMGAKPYGGAQTNVTFRPIIWN